MRGKLTNAIKNKSKELLGYEINVTELRLIAYFDYVMKNNKRIDLNKVDNAELKIITKWVGRNFLTDGVSKSGRPKQSQGQKISITKEFYNAMQEILWLGYVQNDE